MVNNYLAIEINGKKIGLKFGFAQTKEFAIALADNVQVFFDGDTLSPIGIAKLIHTAHKNDCLLKEASPEVTFEEISNWIDESAGNTERIKALTEAVNMWQDSEYTKSWLEVVKKKTGEIMKELNPQPMKSKSSTSKSKHNSGRKATARKK